MRRTHIQAAATAAAMAATTVTAGAATTTVAAGDKFILCVSTNIADNSVVVWGIAMPLKIFVPNIADNYVSNG